eukprot:1437728-Amphidinium_carterae.1
MIDKPPSQRCWNCVRKATQCHIGIIIIINAQCLLAAEGSVSGTSGKAHVPVPDAVERSSEHTQQKLRTQVSSKD